MKSLWHAYTVAKVLRQKQPDGPEEHQECGVVTISE